MLNACRLNVIFEELITRNKNIHMQVIQASGNERSSTMNFKKVICHIWYELRARPNKLGSYTFFDQGLYFDS